MGKEAVCSARWNGQVSEGRAQLEMPHLLFRGDFRLKIPVAGAPVAAKGGTLRIPYEGSIAEFLLGDAADKWAAAILNPKTRLEKMGLKTAMRVRIHGRAPADFLAELRAAGVTKTPTGPVDHSVVFMADAAELRSLADIEPPVWIVYPKGVESISEADVLRAGRAQGWKDVKVCSFCPLKTALRFTLPARVSKGKPRLALS